MNRNIKDLNLQTSNYFINYIQYIPSKKLNNKRIIQRINSSSKDKKSIENVPKQEIKSLKTLSPIKKEKEEEKNKKEEKKYISTNSKIGYLRHFNNNSIYYSNHKKNKITGIYKKQNTNTDIKKDKKKKFFIVRNQSHLNNLINLKRNTKLAINQKLRNFNEDCKNNSNFEELKKINMFLNYNFLNQKSGAKLVKNNILRRRVKINKNVMAFKTKKNLLNVISSRSIFDSSHSQNDENINILNSSRGIQTNEQLIVKMGIFPEIIKPEEYIIINNIGCGSFGKIYKVKWNKNNNNYAMKEMHFQSKENIIYLKERVKYIIDFEKKTKCDGLIKIYGDSFFKRGKDYYYYEVMELAEKDWEDEIKMRKINLNYYSEKELLKIMIQLIKTLSLMQQNHITHRDIKLQNILLVNNKYKICDFGESRKLNQKGTIVQPVRGSELFMSPILFFGLNEKLLQVTHNTYKSDVFSLGMCFLYAASLSDDSLCDIRELTNMDHIRKVIENYLSKQYSYLLIEILLFMLEINEKKRPDFIQLEKVISKLELKF